MLDVSYGGDSGVGMAQFVNDCFDQDNLRIFESLKELAIEADTENCFISGERRFCHLQDD